MVAPADPSPTGTPPEPTRWHLPDGVRLLNPPPFSRALTVLMPPDGGPALADADVAAIQRGDSTIVESRASRDATGRELDALVAEKVMGWRWRGGRGLKLLVAPEADTWYELRGDERIAADAFRDVPHYSTAIAAAWLVVEGLRAEGWDFSLRNYSTWTATFDRMDRGAPVHDADGSTAPLAICRAALLTLETRNDAR